jgi:hypothetical protein
MIAHVGTNRTACMAHCHMYGHDYGTGCFASATTDNTDTEWEQRLADLDTALADLLPKLPTDEELRLAAMTQRQRRRQTFLRPPRQQRHPLPKSHLNQRRRHRGRSR